MRVMLNSCANSNLVNLIFVKIRKRISMGHLGARQPLAAPKTIGGSYKDISQRKPKPIQTFVKNEQGCKTQFNYRNLSQVSTYLT